MRCQGLDSRVQGAGFRKWALGCRVYLVRGGRAGGEVGEGVAVGVVQEEVVDVEGRLRKATQGHILSQSLTDATRFWWHLYGS